VVNPLVWQADFLQLRPESRPVGWRSVGHPLHACNSLVLIVELQSPPPVVVVLPPALPPAEASRITFSSSIRSTLEALR
jgi:hypothetical protein